jgi:hypothetical protein
MDEPVNDEPIFYSKLLKRLARRGTWVEQAESTFECMRRAIEEGRATHAAQLASYLVEECAICYSIMKQWQVDMRNWLQEQGVERAEIENWDAELLGLLTAPDGAEYRSEEAWTGFKLNVLRLVDLAYKNDTCGASALLDELVVSWRIIAGREADWSHGLISRGLEKFGEESMPAIWEKILRALFNWRYARFDVSGNSWSQAVLPELLYVALEAERSWLSTPLRDGARLELQEEPDRWVMRFDPCGTGGRALRGDAVEGTRSRTLQPYGFPVIATAYDWTDGKAGVCSYCNHCQVLMEHWPMDSFGYPLRVVEPPLYPDELAPETQVKCQWTMYKDPRTVPAEIYERAGRTKPTSFGSEPGRMIDIGGASPGRFEECG